MGVSGGQVRSDTLIRTQGLLMLAMAQAALQVTELLITRAMVTGTHSDARAEGGPGFLSGVESLTAVQGQNSV